MGEYSPSYNGRKGLGLGYVVFEEMKDCKHHPPQKGGPRVGA